MTENVHSTFYDLDYKFIRLYFNAFLFYSLLIIMVNQFFQSTNISISSTVIKTALLKYIEITAKYMSLNQFTADCNLDIHFPFYQPTCHESAMMSTICIYLAEFRWNTFYTPYSLYTAKSTEIIENIETDASNLSKSGY